MYYWVAVIPTKLLLMLMVNKLSQTLQLLTRISVGMAVSETPWKIILGPSTADLRDS